VYFLPRLLLYFFSLCFLSYVFTSLLISFLAYLSTPSRIDPFLFQAGGHRRQSNLALVCLGSFYVVAYFVTDACLLLLCLFQLFSTKPRDWLGRTSPKWPILDRLGRKTLINQSIKWPNEEWLQLRVVFLTVIITIDMHTPQMTLQASSLIVSICLAYNLLKYRLQQVYVDIVLYDVLTKWSLLFKTVILLSSLLQRFDSVNWMIGRPSRLFAWHSGRTPVFGRWTFRVLRSTCSCWVTTYVGKPSAIGQPTSPTQPFIPSGSMDE